MDDPVAVTLEGAAGSALLTGIRARELAGRPGGGIGSERSAGRHAVSA